MIHYLIIYSENTDFNKHYNNNKIVIIITPSNTDILSFYFKFIDLVPKKKVLILLFCCLKLIINLLNN